MLIAQTKPLDRRPNLDAPTFLVGDVGGTNCRLALAQGGAAELRLFHARDYKCADFPGAEHAIHGYLDALGWEEAIDAAVLAIAGPVEDGVVQSTNMPWRLSEAELARAGLGHVRLINDYCGLALSVAHLPHASLRPIGPDLAGRAAAPLAVIGAGTGFGAALLLPGRAGPTPIATEGGHAAFAPGDEVELEILRILMRRFGRVSVERLLSGPGLVNLRRALCEIEGRSAEELTPEDIVRLADAAEPLSGQALDRFCAIYGAVAGDFALAYGARGGVFLGGGIAPAILPRLQTSAFRERFEAKGRFRDYLAAVPTRVIMNTQAALFGAAHLARRIAVDAVGEAHA